MNAASQFIGPGNQAANGMENNIMDYCDFVSFFGYDFGGNWNDKSCYNAPLFGGDNVNDAWFPFSNFDPINLMAFSMPIAHLAPWDRLGLSPFTSSSASILNLQWDGLFQKGSPADFVLLDSNSWVKALSERPKRRVVVNGQFLNELPKTQNSTSNISNP